MKQILRRALEALEVYGSHKTSCDSLILFTSLPPQRKPCSCGYSENITMLQTALGESQDDPCPGCKKGGVCRTPKCGRLKLPVDHPLRNDVEPTIYTGQLFKRKSASDEMIRQMRERCATYDLRGAFVDGWVSAEDAHGIRK
jgi:hypothetical protein